MSFINLMNEHLNTYPQMETIDLIKLAYQSVYGPFHLFNSEEVLRKYLFNEENNSKSFIEYLEGDYARYYFDDKSDLDLLLKLFIKSMEVKKDDELFLEYLALIEDRESVNLYLKDGIRDIHHSKRYKSLYKPHYRLLKKDYASYFEVFEKIKEVINKKPNALIAIDGMCCSGKSYLAGLISSIFDVELIHSDDFYLPKADRKTDWFEGIAGNMNIKYLEEAIIQRKYKPFDCRSQSYGSSISLKDKPVIVEGTYSLLANINYDLKIFLSCDLNKQLNRLRNREEDIKSFEDIWLVKERAYFDSFDIKNKTDMIINTDKYF